MNLTESFKKIPYWGRVAAIALEKKAKVWLVGGFLRDEYLDRMSAQPDFDFAVQGDTYAVAAGFAASLKASLVVLDEQQKTYRVVLDTERGRCNYDFNGLRAASLEEDLRLRDFTINTLSVDLSSQPFALHDYCQAKLDLKARRIRMLADRVFVDDPLRALRGFSFMTKLGFTIEPATVNAIKRHGRLLAKVSPERVSEELFKILKAEHCFKSVKLMDDCGVLEVVLPLIRKCRRVRQGKYHHLDVWNHSLETLRQMEWLIQRRFRGDKAVEEYLSQKVNSARPLGGLLKLACLLHDAGKPQAKKRKNKKTIFYAHEKIGADLCLRLAEKLKFSNRESEILKKLVFWHLRPGYLADQIKPSRRAVYRFFQDTGPEGAAVILLSLADWRATRGPLTSPYRQRRHERIMLSLLGEYFAQKKKPEVRLLDGYEVMKALDVPPSPLVGKILKAVKEEQALGRVKTKQQALDLVRRISAK